MLQKLRALNISQKIGLVIILSVSLFYLGSWIKSEHEEGEVSVSGTTIKLREPSGELTEQEMQMAKVAWKYFENNYQPSTGLVNTADGYPSTTMWDTACYLAALVSAHQLGIIDTNTFDTRLAKATGTLSSLKLVDGKLFNKVYNTKTLQPSTYENKPGEIGFSSTDMGRLLTWLKIIKQLYPHFASNVDNVVMRLNFCPMVDKCGNLIGMSIDEKGNRSYTQEGRLGYEEYAAQGFNMWGFYTKAASMIEPYSYIPIYCVNIPYDGRDSRVWGSNFVISEPYILAGLEYGWQAYENQTDKPYLISDPWSRKTTAKIYEVQKRRYQHTGIVTARSEHHLDRPPYFVYDTVYANGFVWNTLTMGNEYLPDLAGASTKVALGFWALYDDDEAYTKVLFDHTANLYDPTRGFYEGLYENGNGTIQAVTANNNGIVLQALLYRKIGPILKGPFERSKWEISTSDEPQSFLYDAVKKCHPMSECPGDTRQAPCGCIGE